MADDHALLAAARAGDQTAFAALYRGHHRRAMHEARKVVHNVSDAEDCVSTAFAATFQAIRKGGGPTEAFRPYLLTTVRNSALQLVRLKRYGSEIATDEVEPAAHVDLYEIGADPAVRNAFANLPARWREVLWQTEIEGRPPRELAAELAMSANSVAALAKRARDGFRQAYLAEAVGPEPHPWAMERLDLYREGALDPRTRDLVELHVESCARCQEALAPVPISAASVGVMLLAAGAVPLVGASAGGAAAGGALVAGVRHLRPRWTMVPAKLATATAAAVAIVGTLLVVAISARSDDRRSERPSSTVVASRPTSSSGAAVAGASVTTAVALRPSPSSRVPATATTAVSTTATTITSPVTDGPTTERVAGDTSTTARRASSTTRRVTAPPPGSPSVAQVDPTDAEATTAEPSPPSPPDTPAPTSAAPTDASTTPATEAPTAPTTPATPTPAAPPAPTAAPPTEAPPTEAPTTEGTTTTTPAPSYGGTLELQRRRDRRTRSPCGPPPPTGFRRARRSRCGSPAPPHGRPRSPGASSCTGLPQAASGEAGEVRTVSCSSPALAQDSSAIVSFATGGSQPVTVVVTAQRPGGLPATQCDPQSAC